jgi:hypothetical protein
VERGYEGLRPEITRPEWALSITCIVLTVLTLATFLIAGRGDDGKPTAKQATESSESARPLTSNAARSKPARSAEKAPSSPKLPSGPGDAPSPVADPVPPPAVAAAAPNRPTLPTLLVDVAPHGYVELRSGAGPSGAFDLEAFASASKHPGEDRAVLSQNGFRRGFVRSWEKPGTTGPSRLVASVFEFGDPIGARALADYETFRVAKEDGGVAFPVDGGSGLRFVHRQGAQAVHGYSVTLHRDDGLLFYFGALYAAPQPPDEVLLVARSQLERLRLHESAALGG